MTGLARQLATAAAVHADLVDAALPGSGGDPDERPTPDPTRKPAPGNLGVMEHRHELVRLLRWWVDAVRDPGEWTQVGHDVAAMCRWLAAHEHVMAPEDARTLYGRVRGWLATSAAIMGESSSAPIDLTTAQLEQRVRVADAARILGCTVRTVQRRVPADARPGGMVRLGDAVRCELCDLPTGQCPHTVRVAVAQ